MANHIIAMSGSHGCLPDQCSVYDSAEDAASGMAQLFELSKRRECELANTGYLALYNGEGPSTSS